MSGELRYLAIEGPIGAGSTTLAERISERLGHETVLDPHDENPFLRDFYEDPQLFALKTQLSFFRLRWEQQKQINRTMTPGKEGNGTGKIITDYLFARDELFARMTLTDAEFEIYDYFVTQIAPPTDEAGSRHLSSGECNHIAAAYRRAGTEIRREYPYRLSATPYRSLQSLFLPLQRNATAGDKYD